MIETATTWNIGAIDQGKAARRRATWSPLETPTTEEIILIADLLGFSEEALSIAAARGLLFCATCCDGHRSFVVSDSRRLSAAAYRLDGCPGSRPTASPGSCQAVSKVGQSVLAKPPFSRQSQTAPSSSLARVSLVEVWHHAVRDLAPGTTISHEHLNSLRARMPVFADEFSFIIHCAQIVTCLVRDGAVAAVVADQGDAVFRIGYAVYDFAIVECLVDHEGGQSLG
jgi:hypothetical protein